MTYAWHTDFEHHSRPNGRPHLRLMPREQVINFKRVQPASDVWAMGATCYHIVTGTYRAHHNQDKIHLLSVE